MAQGTLSTPAMRGRCDNGGPCRGPSPAPKHWRTATQAGQGRWDAPTAAPRAAQSEGQTVMVAKLDNAPCEWDYYKKKVLRLQRLLRGWEQ